MAAGASIEQVASLPMRFPPDFLDELRARLPVSEVVGRRVKLKKAGREWKGLSPFNKEKTPSFFVNDQKQAWFDFSSGKQRRHFRFRHGDRGRHASRKRSSGSPPWPGLPLPKVSQEGEEREERRKTLHDVMELAAKFFEATLAGARRRQGARLSRRPRPRCRDPAQVPHRLCAVRALRAQGASRRARRPGRGHDRGRPAGRRRRHPGAVTTASATA